MHTWKRCEHSPLLYLNHAPKVLSRLKRSLDLYEKLGLSSNSHFAPLLDNLYTYERNKCAVPAAVIHGDPVLTNILLLPPVQTNHDDDQAKKKDELKFIDMRGAQGTHLTLAGDAVYDLAKVFQSLLGYDFILADVPLTIHVVDNLVELVNVFWKMIAQLYPSVQPRHVVTVCAGLVTSLIPLHDNHRHRARFAVVARVLVQALQNKEDVVAGNTKSATRLPKESNGDMGAATLLHTIAHQVDIRV